MNQAFIRDPEAGRWLRFAKPRLVLQTANPPDVMPLLVEAERLVRQQGLYAAGWISYEAAPAFDSAFRTHAATAFPSPASAFSIRPPSSPALPAAEIRLPSPTGWTPSVNREEYETAIARIRDAHRRRRYLPGQLHAPPASAFRGDPWAFFLEDLRRRPLRGLHRYRRLFPLLRLAGALLQPARTNGSSRTDERHRRPGRTLAEDGQTPGGCTASEKNRAENVMIVDMMRNDLGRIARTGSVRVPRLFDIERYPTVWQMTSTVAAQTAASLPDILRALFPCASITGAPKVQAPWRSSPNWRTTPRGIYTGAIGFWPRPPRPVQRGHPHGPDRQARRTGPNTASAAASSGTRRPVRNTRSA